MIYLDNAATTRPNEAAFSRACEVCLREYYNPSARYGGGFAVHRRIEEARAFLLSACCDASKFDLVFTSGGTEADNQASLSAKRGNAVTTAGEHSAVYESFLKLRERGLDVRFAPVDEWGSVKKEALCELVDEKTSLVSVVHVNNETGAVNEIGRLAGAVKQKNPRCLFHSDGVQAYGKLLFRLPAEVDLYSVSAHKIGGLKGTGALIKRKGLALPALLAGGGQEGNLRSGTENVLGILDFAYAAEEKFKGLSQDISRAQKLSELARSALDGTLFSVLSPAENVSPWILLVSAPGVRGEVLQRVLYDRGVCVGTGSACSSKKPHSRILEACGRRGEVLDGVIRLSFSQHTEEEDVLTAVSAMNEAARELKGKI